MSSIRILLSSEHNVDGSEHLIIKGNGNVVYLI